MDVLFIMVGIVLCAFCISKADIKLTITHKCSQPVVEEITQGEVDKDTEQEAAPTYDDIISEVQRILGGGVDGN